jgi:hypothetical protein
MYELLLFFYVVKSSFEMKKKCKITRVTENGNDEEREGSGIQLRWILMKGSGNPSDF